MKMYALYVQNFNSSLETIKVICEKNSRFANFLKLQSFHPDCKLQTFQSFLLMPVQRIPRYKLLLDDLIHNTPEIHYDYDDLEKALKLVSDGIFL